MLRCFGGIAALAKQRLRGIAGIDGEGFRPARARQFLQRIDQHRGDALPGHARMDEQHVDMVSALQRGKADRRVLDGRDQRQLSGELLAERFLVLGRRRPGFLLRFAVVVAGQPFDRGNEDRRQHRNVRRQKRPQAGFGQCLSHRRYHNPYSFGRQRNRAGDQRDLERDIIEPVFRKRRIGLRHHAISHVVTGLPSASLPSLMATPIAASSSRMRSDSLKSFRARAAVAFRNQAVDLLRIDAARLLLASLPCRSTDREKAEQPERSRELGAFAFSTGCRRIAQPVQHSHRLRRVEVVIRALRPSPTMARRPRRRPRPRTNRPASSRFLQRPSMSSRAVSDNASSAY